MTRALLGKEFFERRIYFTVGFLLVCAIAALMPRFFAFSYALATTNSKAPADIVADILHNVRSYSSFIETQWCGRGLARALSTQSLHGLRAAGCVTARLFTSTGPDEEEPVSGPYAMYRKFGFFPIARHLRFRKVMGPDANVGETVGETHG